MLQIAAGWKPDTLLMGRLYDGRQRRTQGQRRLCILPVPAR